MRKELNRLRNDKINERLFDAMRDHIEWASPLDSKPFEVNFKPPFLSQLRIYAYNLTHPPGGRTTGEHKIQLIVPGQVRGCRGSFDYSNGRIVLLLGYEKELDTVVLWDAGMYPYFPYSCNVQVNAETVYAAFAGRISTQDRSLRQRGVETVIAASRRKLYEAIQLRMDLSLKRLLDK